MSIAKICGLETEYGLMPARPDKLSQDDAALALLHYAPLKPKVPWHMSDECPGCDARHDEVAGSGTVTLAASDHAGYMLANGARLYVDHGHPEYATPECLDALSVVACDKAGEVIMDRCRKQVNRFLPVGQSVQLFKNNSDHKGHSYGCHENYMLATNCYRTLFQPHSRPLHAYLIPFLVSRQVITGAGKVGSENRQPAVDFQISQRVDFFETVIGLQTMSRRPIVNTRNEPHADRTRFRRLHVISGDTNMAELSTYLKVGTMQLLLAMLEDRAPINDLTLTNPVTAMGQISHDPTCQQRVALSDGRQLTAIEIQLVFAEAAQRYVDRTAEAQPYTPILQRWIDTLEQLKQDPLQLHHTLDWVIKWRFLNDWRTRKGLTWSAAALKELDIRYHAIDRTKSLFYLLQSSGKVERLIDDKQIERAIEEPLSPTRAVTRARMIKQSGNQIRAASWSTILNKTSQTQQILNNPSLVS